MTSPAAGPAPLTGAELDALARDSSAAAGDPRPVEERHRSHTLRIRRLRRTYFLWGSLVATPGLIMFAISTIGLLGRSAARGTVPLFVTRPVLATVLLVGAVVFGGVGTTMVYRTGSLMHRHHRLLVRAGVHPDRTGSLVR